jgi:hypothetical protein
MKDSDDEDEFKNVDLSNNTKVSQPPNSEKIRKTGLTL